jgi:uncharacterized protein YwqG
MPWWLYLIGAAALFVMWDFRRYTRKRVSPIDKIRAQDAIARLQQLEKRAEPPPREAGPKVTETVSVVLRRQIPPRFGETPRSWIGGLPRMSAHVEWPRSISSEYPEKGERPLHFVAQISCADLPAELWGGLGPRHGWLLLFIDPNQGVPEMSDAFRILHVEDAGEERPAPTDLGPVHDGMYTGPSYDYVRSVAEVPSIWRRWPVDLVVVPNEAHEEKGRTRVAPDNFARILYAPEPVATRDERPEAPQPFTVRGAIYALDALESSYSRPEQPLRIPDQLIERLDQPGYIDTIVPHAEAEERKWRAKMAAVLDGREPEDEKAREQRQRLLMHAQARQVTLEKMVHFLADYPSKDAIVAYLHQAWEKRQQYRDEVRQHAASIRQVLAEKPLDSPFSAEDWEQLKSQLARHECVTWTNDWIERDGERLHVSFREIKMSVALKTDNGMRELVADYYVDPERRALIPPDILASYEASWRRLRSNRPHRIGGYHDGLQSDARIGPTEDLLLFQIASDDAMNWCWGDVGAYYFFIRPQHLEAMDFSQVEITLECH